MKSSNSTTIFWNINREQLQIRSGKILQLTIKNLETNSSNLIFLNEPGPKRRRNFSLENTEKMIESSNSTTMFRNINRGRFQIRGADYSNGRSKIWKSSLAT